MSHILESFFFYGDPVFSGIEKGAYQWPLVFLSYAVASFASYVALSMAQHLVGARALSEKRLFHWGGAFAMGAGIWSMHFIGMLSYKMRMVVHYDPALTVLSLAVAIGVAYGVLGIVARDRLPVSRLAGGAVLLGIGICAMHYTGMAAMKMDGDLRYAPGIFLLSVVIAIAASGAALWIAFTLSRHDTARRGLLQTGAALVMGVAICGMHYTGMIAAVIQPYANCHYDPDQDFEVLALTIAVITGVILGLALLTGLYRTRESKSASMTGEARPHDVPRGSGRRFAVLVSAAVLFALPLMVIVYEAVSSMDAGIYAVHKESCGIRYHGLLMRVFGRLQETRGAAFLSRNGDAAAASRLPAKKEDVLEALAATDDMSESCGTTPLLRQAWHEARQSVIGILREKRDHSALEEFRDYSNVIATFLQFMNFASDTFRLTVDPEVDMDYLSDAMINVTPLVMETLGRMRGLTAGLLVSGTDPLRWPGEVRKELTALQSQVIVQREDLSDALRRAGRADDRASSFAGTRAAAAEAQYAVFDRAFTNVVLRGRKDISAAAMSRLATGSISAYEELYGALSSGFVRLLQERESALSFRKKLVLYSSGTAFLGFIMLFSFLSLNLTRLEQSKRELENETRTVTLLRRVAETSNKVSDLEEAVRIVLELVCGFTEWPVGHAYAVDQQDGLLKSRKLWFIQDAERFQTFKKITEEATFGPGVGLPGRAWQAGAPVWIADVAADDNFLRLKMAAGLGMRSGFAFPVIGGGATHVLEFFSAQAQAPDARLLEIMEDIGGQLALVAERGQAQEALKQLKEKAEAANIAKSDFLANMSHELRTPLNSILGMTRLLLEAGLEKAQRELAETVFTSSTNLLEIVNDILDLSKIEAGEMKLESIGFDPAYVFDSAAYALGHTAREKRLPLNVVYDKADFPYLLGDPLRLTRVLMNLIGNAIKYTDRGHVEFRAFCRKTDDGRVEIRCEIADTGIGIPKEKQKDIFDKFVQADASTTRRYGGTGLGLAITKQLVELMGGVMGVESAPGEGSTFWFTAPFAVTDTLSETKLQRRRKAALGTLDPAKARVLVAEDHPLNQAFIRKMLEKFAIGHFELVDNGSDALRKCRDEKWDLLLMDCHMPLMNGYDTTREIRTLEKDTGARLPIVAMTANAMMGEKEKCLRYGMDDYISKPINMDELKDILGQWLRFGGAAEAGGEAEAASGASSPVDLAQIKGFCDGDRDEEKSLVAMFLGQSDKNMKVLAKSCGTDARAWKETAHMLKGGAGGIGAHALGKLCGEAQHFDGPGKKRAELLARIEAEYGRVASCLRALYDV